MAVVVGIDPGLQGAVAVLRDGAAPWVEQVLLRPVNAKDEEVDALWMFKAIPEDTDLIVLEKVGIQPMWASKACFRFGESWGQCLATIRLTGKPSLRVLPQLWKAEVLEGTDHSKKAAIAYVQRLFPNLSLKPRKGEGPSEDMAEAMCMARYGQMYLREQGVNS